MLGSSLPISRVIISPLTDQMPISEISSFLMGLEKSELIYRFDTRDAALKEMSSTSIDTAIYHPDGSPSASSYLLGSASASSPSIQWNDKKISRTFTQAKNAYSTKQFVQAYSALQPLITVSSYQEDESLTTTITGSAPIVKAKTSLRIKVWCLYLSVLSEIIDSESADFKSAYGRDQYDSIKSRFANSSIWEQVINDGYEGQLSRVDSIVVQALGLHLVRKATSQKPNITNLETYLSTLTDPNSDAPTPPFQSQDPNASEIESHHHHHDDTYTLILQTLILAALKDGQEPYARELISRIEILDDEQREELLQSMIHSEGLERPQPPPPPNPEQNPPPTTTQPKILPPPQPSPKTSTNHPRPPSTTQDYGIEPPSRTTSKPPPPSSSILTSISHLVRNPLALLPKTKSSAAIIRLALFLAALLVALSRRGVKEVLKRAMEKVKRTVGMGVGGRYI